MSTVNLLISKPFFWSIHNNYGRSWFEFEAPKVSDVQAFLEELLNLFKNKNIQNVAL